MVGSAGGVNGWNVLLSIAASFATVAFFVATIGRWLWRRFMQAVVDAAVDRLMPYLERIERQVTPNHGSKAKIGDQVVDNSALLQEILDQLRHNDA